MCSRWVLGDIAFSFERQNHCAVVGAEHFRVTGRAGASDTAQQSQYSVIQQLQLCSASYGDLHNVLVKG
jgi:hypothetical protein